jgi:ABC-type branched-subunit amino acid transport system ATPase component
VLGDLIRRIRDERHMTVLLVEHHMGLVMSIADHVVALNFGRKLAEGTPAQVQADPDVIKPISGARTNDRDAQHQGSPRLLRPGPGASRPELLPQRGSLTTLLGANGAGKTTTLRAICNMVRSTGRSSSRASRCPASRPKTSSVSASRMCRRAAAPSPP